jgi:hypothetical protein
VRAGLVCARSTPPHRRRARRRARHRRRRPVGTRTVSKVRHRFVRDSGIDSHWRRIARQQRGDHGQEDQGSLLAGRV